MVEGFISLGYAGAGTPIPKNVATKLYYVLPFSPKPVPGHAVTVVYFLFFIPSHRRLADKIYKDTINYKTRTNELVF